MRGDPTSRSNLRVQCSFVSHRRYRTSGGDLSEVGARVPRNRLLRREMFGSANGSNTAIAVTTSQLACASTPSPSARRQGRGHRFEKCQVGLQQVGGSAECDPCAAGAAAADCRAPGMRQAARRFTDGVAAKTTAMRARRSM